jgi:hypothetical protein
VTFASYPEPRAIRAAAEWFMRELSADEWMVIGACVAQCVDICRSLPRRSEWVSKDEVAKVVFLATVKFPFNFIEPRFPPVRRITASVLLAAYAYFCSRVAEETANTTYGRQLGLDLATRALAMAHALEEADPGVLLSENNRKAANARHARMAKVRAIAGSLYQVDRQRHPTHSTRSIAARIAPAIVQSALDHNVPFRSDDPEPTIYRWLLKDFPKQK